MIEDLTCQQAVRATSIACTTILACGFYVTSCRVQYIYIYKFNICLAAVKLRGVCLHILSQGIPGTW